MKDAAIDPQIPYIDLTPARTGSKAERLAVAAEIDAACRDVGFFNLTGHGIDPGIIQRAYDELERFLALPQEVKETCRLPGGATMSADEYTPYGYSALLEENAFAYMGVEGKPADYVEKFSVGYLVNEPGADLPFPPGPQGQAFRKALGEYYTAVDKLSAFLAGMFEIGLDLPPGHLSGRIDASNDSMRCHSYPAVRPEFVNDQGMGTHKDGSLITMLTHTRPGIDVRTRGGQWIKVPCKSIQDFTINIGDLLAHWTENQYVSTPHRVVLSDENRLSIVFFKLTNEDEIVAEGNKQMDALFGR
jgi:isopenicillin N synthase-like dioxygenase